MATFFKSYLGEVTVTDTDSRTIGSGSYHLVKDILICPPGVIYVVKEFKAAKSFWAGYQAALFLVNKRTGITLLQSDAVNSNGQPPAPFYPPSNWSAGAGYAGTNSLIPYQESLMFFPGDKVSLYTSGLDGAVGYAYTLTATFRAYAI